MDSLDSLVPKQKHTDKKQDHLCLQASYQYRLSSSIPSPISNENNLDWNLILHIFHSRWHFFCFHEHNNKRKLFTEGYTNSTNVNEAAYPMMYWSYSHLRRDPLLASEPWSVLHIISIQHLISIQWMLVELEMNHYNSSFFSSMMMMIWEKDRI